MYSSFPNLNNFKGEITLSEIKNEFSAREQLVKDYFSAIIVLKNVVPLLKEAGRIEKELAPLESIISETKKDFNSLIESKKFFSDEDTSKFIDEKVNELKKQNVEALDKQKELSIQLSEINKKIDEYKIYAESIETSMSEIMDFSFINPEKFTADELIAYIFTRTTRHTYSKRVKMPEIYTPNKEISDIFEKSTFCNYTSFTEWVKTYYNQ